MLDGEEDKQIIEEPVISELVKKDEDDAELGMVDHIGSAFAEGAINGSTLVNTLIEEEETPGWGSRLLNLKSSIFGRNWFSTMRPVTEFCAPSKFKKPAGKGEVVSRLHANFSYFFTNYVAMFFVFMVFTIITSPLLFFSALAITYGWYWAAKQEKLSLGPITLEGNTKYVTLSLITLCITLLIAGTSIIWVLALTATGSGVHAIMHVGGDAITNGEDGTLELENLV